MNLFWIGIIVFAIGFIIRYILKFKMYNEFKSRVHTDKQKQEISMKYRPLIYMSLCLQVIGCIIGIISIWE